MSKRVAMLVAFALLGAACSGASPSTTLAGGGSSSTVTTVGATSSSPTEATTSSLAPTTTLDPGVPRFGGEVVIVDDQEPPTLNPYAPGGDNFIVAIIGQAHLAGMYDVDPETLELIPDLATEIPTLGNGGVVVNQDGSMDVTWNIRPEAEWSDGVAISGTDLAFTLEFEQLALDNCAFAFKPEGQPEHTIVEIGDKSLTARFPQAGLQHEMMLRWIVPIHAVKDTDPCEDWNEQAWPAGGPFIVTNWVRVGSERSVRLERNLNYWKFDESGERLPYLDAVDFRFQPENERVIADFAARRVDVMQPPPFIPGLDIEQLEAEGADVQVLTGPVWEHLNFQFGSANRNPDTLNEYVEFRRAVAHAIDKRRLLDDAGWEWLDVSNSLVGHSTATATSEPWSQYQYDPDLARQLLSAACERAGRDCDVNPPRIVFSTTSNADFRPAIARQLVVQLAEVGIDVELQLEDSQLFFGETLDTGSWDMGQWAWVGLPGAAELVHLLRVFHPNEPPPDGHNIYRWGTPGSLVEGEEPVLQAAVLLDTMRTTADADLVFTLARQFEEILADQVVVIPLNARAVVGAVWADEIGGYQMNPSQSGHTWNIEWWYRK